MEAPASWRKRTVEAPMPFAPPDNKKISGVRSKEGRVKWKDKDMGFGSKDTGAPTGQDDNLAFQLAKLRDIWIKL